MSYPIRTGARLNQVRSEARGPPWKSMAMSYRSSLSNRPSATSRRSPARPRARGATTTWLRSVLWSTTGAAAGSTTYVSCASGKRSRSARMAGVVKTTSPIWRRRTSRIFNQSRLDGCFIDQHHRDVVFDRVDAVAGGTLQGRAIFDQMYWRFAVRTGENFEQFLVNGHARN